MLPRIKPRQFLIIEIGRFGLIQRIRGHSRVSCGGPRVFSSFVSLVMPCHAPCMFECLSSLHISHRTLQMSVLWGSHLQCTITHCFCRVHKCCALRTLEIRFPDCSVNYGDIWGAFLMLTFLRRLRGRKSSRTKKHVLSVLNFVSIFEWWW